MRSLTTVLLSILCLSTFAVERDATNLVKSSSDLLNISNTDVFILDQWELSKAEWDRYEELMEGIRGRLSNPNISPIEVLGIHARTDSERSHYARIWARMMREDAIRVLRFQRAYDVAARALQEDEPLIDLSLLPETTDPQDSQLTKADRVMVFVGLACPLCDIVFDRVHDRLSELGGIDVYFVDTAVSDSDKIREWANERGINANHVQTGTITINHDDGLLKSIDPNGPSLPILKRQRDNEITPVKLKHLPLYKD